MKKHLFIGLSLIAALSGCSTNEELNRSDFKSLAFETFVGKGTTRAAAKTAFADGDNFGVIAYRHGTTGWSADGATKELFMENVPVTLQGGLWTYSPTMYWDEGVKHTFLAYSPYNAGYILDPASEGHLLGVTTAESASGQIDLLYSLPEAGSKDLEWSEGKKVVITFRHALSQIRISASTDQDYSGYYTATIRKVRLTGIANSSELNLDTADVTVSPWSNQGVANTNGEGVEEIPAETPEVVNAKATTTKATATYAATTGDLEIPLSTAETLLNGVDNLFMQLPQAIMNGETAAFEITYDVVAAAAGNESNAGTGKVAIIKIPAITWEHNHIYHYKIQMDLQQLLSLKPIEVDDPDVVEWEAGTETKLPEDLTVTIAPSAEGDTEQTGTGNAELGITKSSEPGTQTVHIANPEVDDQWIVEVGSEITDATPANTRAEKKEPAWWLTVRNKTAGGTATAKLYGKTDADIEIITEENTLTTPRKAEVIIRRALSGVTRILVTQEGAPAAIIEANSTQFPMTGGTNQLTITNKSSEMWTLSKDEQADWLTLVDDKGATVTGGAGGTFIVKATADANLTAAERTATITLDRGSSTAPLLVKVTQAAPEPMSISSGSFGFSYSGGSQTLTVTNPEGGKEGFAWTLARNASATADCLTATPTTGTTVSGKVTFTTASINTFASTRTATFTLSRQGQSDIPITMTQTGAPASTLSPSSLSVDYTAQSRTFNVASPTGIGWTVSSNQSWATLSRTSGNGNASVSVSVTENTSFTNTRTARFTLSREGQIDVSLSLTQGAAPDVITAEPAYYKQKPQDGLYRFAITAPAGKTWTATVSNWQNLGFFCIVKKIDESSLYRELTCTVNHEILVYVKGVPATNNKAILVQITPEDGSEPLTLYLLFHPSF